MDRWILKQLRAQILCDLEPLIPEGYFEQDKNKFRLSNIFPSHEHLSKELHWGYKAAKLGRELYLDNNGIQQPRVVAASDVLINLGLLTASDVQKASCKFLSEQAKDKKIDDGNSTTVYEQLKNEIVPTFEKNIQGALIQYLKYLPPSEAKPFLSLVKSGEGDVIMTPNTDKEIEKRLSENTQYILNISAPLYGNIQQGEGNRLTINNTNTTDKIFTPIVVGIISTVAGGIFLYFLIEFIKNKP